MRYPLRPEFGLLALRIAMGSIFLLHGWTKLFAGQQSFVLQMLRMAGWSISGPWLWLVMALEVLGGLALLVGLFARPAAVLLAAEMVVAVALFHLREGFFIVAVPNVPLAYGFEYHVALVAGLLCLALGGPGAWALEGRIFAGAGGGGAASG